MKQDGDETWVCKRKCSKKNVLHTTMEARMWIHWIYLLAMFKVKLQRIIYNLFTVLFKPTSNFWQGRTWNKIQKLKFGRSAQILSEIHLHAAQNIPDMWYCNNFAYIYILTPRMQWFNNNRPSTEKKVVNEHELKITR